MSTLLFYLLFFFFLYSSSLLFSFFFFNDTATTEIYTLSLHDALPIYIYVADTGNSAVRLLTSAGEVRTVAGDGTAGSDRKSTRLNSSHSQISYAVFCLKKKKKKKKKRTKKKTKKQK